MLEDALSVCRERSHREALVRGAREQFIEASVGAPSAIKRASAEWHLGITWLLSQEPDAAEKAWIQARNAALCGLAEARDSLDPTSDEVVPEQMRLLNPVQRFLGSTNMKLTYPSQWDAAVSLIRSRRRPEMEAALALAVAIQGSRQALGVAGIRCASPALGPPRSGGEPEVIIPLGDEPIDFCGWAVYVHDARNMREVMRKRFYRELECTVELMLRATEGDATSELRLEGGVRPDDRYPKPEAYAEETPIIVGVKWHQFGTDDNLWSLDDLSSLGDTGVRTVARVHPDPPSPPGGVRPRRHSGIAGVVDLRRYVVPPATAS